MRPLLIDTAVLQINLERLPSYQMGLEKGIEKGLEEGEHRKALAIAETLLAMNFVPRTDCHHHPTAPDRNSQKSALNPPDQTPARDSAHAIVALYTSC